MFIWDFLSDSANAGAVGCVFFFVVFCYILITTYLPSKKQKINDLANIPLRD